MRENNFKKRFLSFFIAFIMIVGLLPLHYISNANAEVKASEIYLDSAKGDDNSDGSKDKPVKTFAKAIEKTKDGDTLNVVSLSETNIIVSKKITLKFISDVTMQGNGTAIELKEGSHLCVAEGKTLNISDYNKGILVEKGAEINDGNYVFKFPKSAFAFETSGNIVGSFKEKLKIDITNGYFMFHSKDNELRNATINQRYEGDKWQLYEWNGFKAFNSEINLYRLPVYLKGPLYLDNTKFVIDGTGVRYQTGAFFENSWEAGDFHFTNNSIFEVKNFSTHWRAKGITLGNGYKVLVDKGSKIIVKNNANGGFNINKGIATFNGGYLEGDGHSGSLFGAQAEEGTKIVFGADSVVNTPMKSDSDNGLGQTGANYIVIGGSHKVKYSPDYQGGLAIPVNGEENGNEKLTWFQLTDKSIEKINPINKNGKTYDYSVKNPSDDGNKYVWTPAAKVTFKLNNNDASFADKTNEDKEFKTIRGYKLDDVVGNENPGNPSDKNGVKFLGWYYKTAKGEEKAFDWNEKLNSDIEVYAKWERKTAIYHNGAGKDYISSVSKDAKDIEVLSFEDILKEKEDFKVEGKKFIGWTTASDGSGKVYNPKEKIDFKDTQTQIDLYAKYTDDEYKVSFSANGGTFSENSIFKTQKDVFTIEKDKNGGDVAVLKKTAKYNDKLFDLLNGLDHNSLKPDKDATKTGFVIKNNDSWSKTTESGYDTIRFDDYIYSIFGHSLTFSGENPKITKDTTYYLTWKDDPNITDENKISSQETIDSDIWSDSRETSKDIKIISENKEFSLTGEVNVSSIKDKMKAIEGMFKKEEKDFDKISLTGAKSTFTATLTLPKEVEAPKNLQVEAKGLGDCFEVSETKVNGKKITVTFKLNDGMTDYKKLKDAVFSTGGNDNTLSVTVNGLKLKDFDKITNGEKFTIKGEVKGEFSSVAKEEDTIKKFDFKWTGNQSQSGKDVEAKDDSAIQYTIMVSKPVQLTLGGDLLVKKANENYDTEHDSIYPVDKEDLLTFDGKLDVSSIKNQIQSLKDDFDKNNNNTSDEITTKDVKSEFIAELTVPEGLELPKDLKATLTENNLFKVESTEANGNKITVKMTLKKDYTKFTDLYTDVTSVSDTLDLEISNIKVKDTAKGNLTVKGEVTGTFIGAATKDLKTKVFNYKWTGKQTPDGKDFTQSEDDNDSINLTVNLPQELTLGGDILIGDDTEHNALHGVKRGENLEYTGRLDVSSIKKQIQLLKDNYKGNSDTIITKDIKSEFIAELTVPEGLEIPQDLKATLTENNLFKVESTEVNGNKIIVKMTLKNANYTKFTDLYTDVTSVPDTLDLKVKNIKVKDDVKSGEQLTVIGNVNGVFKGIATTKTGKKESYNYLWTAEQIEDGKDFLIKDQKDNKTIQYTVILPYKVSYKFKSADGKNLPEEVTNLLPKSYEIEKGQTAYLNEAEKNEKLGFEDVKVADGIWKFKAWNKTKEENVNKDLTFTGTWEFIKNLKVNYDFKSEDGKNLPDKVTSLLPKDEKTYKKGEKVQAKEPNQKQIEVSDGKWEFVGYDKKEQTIADKDITFTGTWKFIKNLKVNYNFKSADGKKLPEEVTNLLPKSYEIEKGQTAYLNEAEKNENLGFEDVKVADGIWKFKAWDKTKEENVDKDLTFTGTWKFTSIKPFSNLNNTPQLEVADKEIMVGETLNLKTLIITATDKEDGDLKNKVEINKGEFNNNKVGTYKITYKVADSIGATTVKQATVKVKQPQMTLNEAPNLQVKDAEITVGETLNLKDLIISATDKEDGDLKNKVEINKGEFNNNKVGTYKITYKVADTKGAATTKQATVKVKQPQMTLNEAPNLQVKDAEITVGETLNLKDLIISATDKEDGDLKNKVEINKGEFNNNKVGTYKITYKVADTKGAATTKQATVKVKQPQMTLNEAPNLQVKDAEITVGETLNLKDLIISATDKEDGDLKDKVQIVDKGGFDNNKVGTYKITYKVADSKGASVTKTATVIVKEKETTPVPTPENQAPNLQVKDAEITVGEILDLKTLIIKATDKEDGDLKDKVQIVDKGGFDNNKVGTYKITYKVTDSKGATATKQATVKVKEKQKPQAPENKKPKPKPKQEKGVLNEQKTLPKTSSQTPKSNKPLITLLAVGLAALAGLTRRKRK